VAKASDELNGAQRAAMLIMSLDEEQAAAVLRHMSESSLRKLRKAAETLDVTRISEEDKRETLKSFFVTQRKGHLFLGDPDERFRRMLTRAKGEENIGQFYEDEAPLEEEADESDAKQDPLAYMVALPDEQIVAVLEKESPRCAAVLLSHLPGQKAGSVLNMMEEERREAIVERMIRVETVPPIIAQQVVSGFQEKMEEAGAGADVASGGSRAEDLASIVGTLDRQSQERVLSQINDRDPEMALEIERLLFGFEDLVKVGSKSMQELLRNADVAHIAMALKGASLEMTDHFTKNMSQRVRERVEEEREMAGRVPLSQVEEAREEIMKVARKLYREGNLVVEIGDEQYVE